LPLNSQERSFYQGFGRLLARIRNREHFSQEGLAMALGLSRTSVTNIERGRQPVQIHTLYRIADVLGVELAELLPGPSEASARETSEVSLKQHEWLQKIVPHGDLKNAKIAGKSSRTSTKNPQGQQDPAPSRAGGANSRELRHRD
jgi:transcriptional regulator with XRE-family HTH domain